jgi:hypothetical protein
MKRSSWWVWVVGVGAAALLAQEAGKQGRDSTPIPAAAAKVTAPLVLKEGALVQADRTDLPEGGKAVFEFTVAKAGTYYIHALVDAPGEDANSFYLSIDGPPTDPLMIWDIDVTNGFEERLVNWRGKGEPESPEFRPRRFELTAGAHQLILTGREPTARFKSFWLRPAAK